MTEEELAQIIFDTQRRANKLFRILYGACAKKGEGDSVVIDNGYVVSFDVQQPEQQRGRTNMICAVTLLKGGEAVLNEKAKVFVVGLQNEWDGMMELVRKFRGFAQKK